MNIVGYYLNAQRVDKAEFDSYVEESLRLFGGAVVFHVQHEDGVTVEAMALDRIMVKVAR